MNSRGAAEFSLSHSQLYWCDHGPLSVGKKEFIQPKFAFSQRQRLATSNPSPACCFHAINDDDLRKLKIRETQ